VNIVSFSASHRDLALDVLESLSVGAGGLGSALLEQAPGARGAVVLATCNRFETYVDLGSGAADEGDRAATRDAVVGLIAAATGLPDVVVRGALRTRVGRDAVTHLFDVASGLDSMIVGEREINGQVRRALAAAHAAGTTSTALEQVFQRASRVSRQVEAATGLGANGRSVVSVGLDLAAASAPPWRAARAVLIGTGSYAGAAVAALRARGCTDVRVHSTTGRASAFAQARGLTAVQPDGLVEALADADVVVACSGHVGTVVDAAALTAARQRAAARAASRAHEPDRPARPLVILDLALARDVEAQAADVDGVLLLDLATIQQHAPAVGAEPVARAREIVARGVDELERWTAERSVTAQIVRLRAESEAGTVAELEVLAGALTEVPADLVHEVRARRARTLHQAIVDLKRQAARVGEITYSAPSDLDARGE